MEDKKKAVAAMAAVMSYITTEEEALCIQSMAGPAPRPGEHLPGPVKLWGASGRQYQMQIRNLMQLRTFR